MAKTSRLAPAGAKKAKKPKKKSNKKSNKKSKKSVKKMPVKPRKDVILDKFDRSGKVIAKRVIGNLSTLTPAKLSAVSRKVTKLVKDLDKPKKARRPSGYILFYKKNFAKVNAKEQSVTKTAKVIGKMWAKHKSIL